MKYRLIFSFFTLLCWAGCYEEDPLSPSGIREFKYSVPQGEHDYDDRIVDWHEKGGFYILYKFDPKDIYFNIYRWEISLYDSINGMMDQGILGQGADENYVGKQLDLLEETFLNFYSDTTLHCWMPSKLLLCSELKTWPYYGASTAEDMEMFNGFDNIAINYGNAGIETLLADRDRKRQFMTELNKLLFKRAIDREKLKAPEDFANVSDYRQVIGWEERYQLGFLGDGNKTVQDDFNEYVNAIISYSYAELNEETEDENYDYVGILHPKKDVNGLIRKKYDAVIRYLKNTWHIDLQAIGNYQKQQ